MARIVEGEPGMCIKFEVWEVNCLQHFREQERSSSGLFGSYPAEKWEGARHDPRARRTRMILAYIFFTWRRKGSFPFDLG